MTEVPEPIAVQCMIQQQLLNRTVKAVPGNTKATQKATGLIYSHHWHILVKPQLQGIKWIKVKPGSDLKVIYNFSQNGKEPVGSYRY